jgi:hypothetical protein
MSRLPRYLIPFTTVRQEPTKMAPQAYICRLDIASEFIFRFTPENSTRINAARVIMENLSLVFVMMKKV